MEKYSGNQKGFIYASCDANKQQEVFKKYLEPIAKDGVRFCWGDAFDKKEEDNIARSNAVLVFMTNDFAKEDRLRRTVEAAVRYDKPILTVYLENVDLDAGLSMQLESQQALFVSYYENDEEFIEALKNAAIFDRIEVTEQQKKKQKKRSLLAIAAALVTLLVLAIILKPLLTPSNANAETMEALGLAGVSKSELESISELHVVGGEVIDNVGDIGLSACYENAAYENINRNQVYYSVNGYCEEEKQTEAGNISDLSGIEQMKNLQTLAIDGEQIEDISPILKLENLENLNLACNPVSSLDGIEKLPELKTLDITCTNIKKLPEGLHLKTLLAHYSKLESLPDFNGEENVTLRACDNDLTDYSNLSTAKSYDLLDLQGNGVDDQLFEHIKGIPIRQLLIADTQNLDSMDDLQDLIVEEELLMDGPNDRLTSIEGIEHFEGIKRLSLCGYSSLTDLSPINKLESLEELRISRDMEALADKVDGRIRIEIVD